MAMMQERKSIPDAEEVVLEGRAYMMNEGYKFGSNVEQEDLALIANLTWLLCETSTVIILHDTNARDHFFDLFALCDTGWGIDGGHTRGARTLPRLVSYSIHVTQRQSFVPRFHPYMPE